MKLINSKYEIIEQNPGLDGIYEAIEQAGRTCYKSIGTRYFKIPLCSNEVPSVWHEIKLDTTCNKSIYTYGSGIGKNLAFGYVSIANKDVSKFPELEKYECEKTKYHRNLTAKEFVDRMVKSGHGAMLEFGTVYLKIRGNESKGSDIFDRYHHNIYSKTMIYDNCLYISSNYRVLIKNEWLDDLKYLCEPTEFHEKRICVRFNCSIGISRELNRHRVDSIAEMSTRYCNFSKDKFGNELTFVIPSHLNEEELKKYGPYHTVVRNKKSAESIFIANLNNAEKDYLDLIDSGWKAQQARDILPLATATEVNHCAFVSDWKHFFELRDSEAAHPDMRKLAKPLHEEFINRGYLK
jgi:thymidylate synthase (FAD)